MLSLDKFNLDRRKVKISLSTKVSLQIFFTNCQSFGGRIPLEDFVIEKSGKSSFYFTPFL